MTSPIITKHIPVLDTIAMGLFPYLFVANENPKVNIIRITLMLTPLRNSSIVTSPSSEYLAAKMKMKKMPESCLMTKKLIMMRDDLSFC